MNFKGSFGSTTDWKDLVARNGRLLRARCPRYPPTMETFPQIPEWVQLEHQVQTILTEQEIHGWTFNKDAAWQLASTLKGELREIESSLRRRHPYVAGAEFTPKRNNSRQGYEAGRTLYSTKRVQPYI